MRAFRLSFLGVACGHEKATCLGDHRGSRPDHHGGCNGAGGPKPQTLRLSDGSKVDGCSQGTESIRKTFDYFEDAGGGTREKPVHPFPTRTGDLPYASELVSAGDAALVRPDPNGPGNDVIYELEALRDGTFLVSSVFFCLTRTADGRVTEREEFTVEPTELTQELVDDGAYIDENGVITDG